MTTATKTVSTQTRSKVSDQANKNIAYTVKMDNYMDFQIMKGEEDYESPKEISIEALKRIEKMKKRGSALARIANLVNY